MHCRYIPLLFDFNPLQHWNISKLLLIEKNKEKRLACTELREDEKHSTTSSDCEKEKWQLNLQPTLWATQLTKWNLNEEGWLVTNMAISYLYLLFMSGALRLFQMRFPFFFNFLCILGSTYSLRISKSLFVNLKHLSILVTNTCLFFFLLVQLTIVEFGGYQVSPPPLG